MHQPHHRHPLPIRQPRHPRNFRYQHPTDLPLHIPPPPPPPPLPTRHPRPPQNFRYHPPPDLPPHTTKVQTIVPQHRRSRPIRGPHHPLRQTSPQHQPHQNHRQTNPILHVQP